MFQWLKELFAEFQEVRMLTKLQNANDMLPSKEEKDRAQESLIHLMIKKEKEKMK